MSSLYLLVVSFMFVNNLTFLERIERNTYFNDISMIFHAYPIIIMHLQVSMRIQNSVSDEVGETVHTTPESGAVNMVEDTLVTIISTDSTAVSTEAAHSSAAPRDVTQSSPASLQIEINAGMMTIFLIV